MSTGQLILVTLTLGALVQGQDGLPADLMHFGTCSWKGEQYGTRVTDIVGLAVETVVEEHNRVGFQS